jgi:hypothetical protein
MFLCSLYSPFSIRKRDIGNKDKENKELCGVAHVVRGTSNSEV